MKKLVFGDAAARGHTGQHEEVSLPPMMPIFIQQIRMKLCVLFGAGNEDADKENMAV